MSEELVCVNCNQTIKTGDYLQLGEKSYHTKHFWCFICKKLLECDDFSELNDQIYCEQHFLEASGAPKCSKCEKYINGEYDIIVGKPFHPECFLCDFCKKPFPKNEYYKSEKNLLCALCFHKYKAVPCYICSKPIIDQIYNALGRTYHYDCLVCLKCGKTFNESGFITIDDNPFHEDCVAVYCCQCGENIENEYIEVDKDILHENCLESYKKLKREQKKIENKININEIQKKAQQKNDQILLSLEEEQKKELIEIENKKKALANINKNVKKGPPCFSEFMKNTKKNIPSSKLESPVKEKISNERYTEKSIKIESPTQEKISNEKLIDFKEKPNILNNVEQEKKIEIKEKPEILGVKLEEKIKEIPKEKPQITSEKIDDINNINSEEENKNEEPVIFQIPKNKKEEHQIQKDEESSTTTTVEIKIEKKFIKMHNRFKKL